MEDFSRFEFANSRDTIERKLPTDRDYRRPRGSLGWRGRQQTLGPGRVYDCAIGGPRDTTDRSLARASPMRGPTFGVLVEPPSLVGARHCNGPTRQAALAQPRAPTWASWLGAHVLLLLLLSSPLLLLAPPSALAAAQLLPVVGHGNGDSYLGRRIEEGFRFLVLIFRAPT